MMSAIPARQGRHRPGLPAAPRRGRSAVARCRAELAGGFGNYVSIPSALRIGLIPELPAERVRYVGNAASLGAQLCLLSEAERARAAEVAGQIEHVSLAAHPDFEQIFVDCMNFPPPR